MGRKKLQLIGQMKAVGIPCPPGHDAACLRGWRLLWELVEREALERAAKATFERPNVGAERNDADQPAKQ